MSSNSDDIQAAGSDTRPPMLDRTDYESWSQRIRLYCRGKENGLQILQSIDQGPFELGTTRDHLEPHLKAVFVTAVKLNKGLKEINHEQLYAYLKQHEKHAAQDRLIIEKITPTTNDPLAFVLNVQPYAQLSHVLSKQHPSSSTPLQSPHVQSLQYSQFPESSHVDSGYSQTDEIIDTLTKQVAFLAQSFRVTLPQIHNQLQTSSNTRNQATVQDAGNEGAQNRAGNDNAGQGKPIKCYNCNGLGHIARNCTQPKCPQNFDFFKDNECDAFDSDVDDEPTAQSIFMANLSSTGPANLQAGPSNASILSEVHDLENSNSNVILYEQYLSDNEVFVEPSCAPSVLIDASVLHNNNAYIPHDPLVTELSIYKQQVSMYEQLAKFDLTLREQKMDEQMRMLIQDRNKKEENIKNELHSVKLQLNSTIKSNTIIEETNPFYLRNAKVAQPALYDGDEILKTHHVPVSVTSFEEDLEIAEDVFYTVTDSALSASQFHDLSIAYNVAMTRVVELESENTKLLNKIQHDSHDTMSSKDDQIQGHRNTIRKLKAQISQLKANKSDVIGTGTDI
ncbi:retrovirus-related pol polyprotein from transposon TNT 1-94 [Tanacetum coccineum]